MKKILAIALVGASFAVAGCNTVAGAGKDVEKSGQAVQDASHSVSKDISKDKK